ncbi:MAG TPA: phosphate ABC transporter permease PstA [Pirellulales bacterium]|jgi:phosphate transport system permease protein|nr:phosphate ABC transporter permease PstA [Pirellulales bacterium]
MPDTQGNHFRYYVGPRAAGAGDGSATAAFDSVGTVIEHIAHTHARSQPGATKLRGHDRVDICRLADRAGNSRGAARPRYRFYVDPLGSGLARATGTAKLPWPDLETAVAGLEQLDRRGAIPLDPGECLSLHVREVFSATPVDRAKRRRETIARYVLLCVTLTMVVPLVLILTHLVAKAWPVLSPSFIFENPHNNMSAGGVWAPLVGTFYLVFISLLAAAPIGVLAGVYLNEYAGDNWFTRIVNLAVLNLAGVPSIVHALFGVGAFVMFAGMGYSVLAAACTLAIMTLPVIISSTREALASVPMTFREACWNMGASRWQTIRTIVLPNSISGILTGVILQVSRAAGETAPILFTGAAYFMNVPNRGLRYFLPYSLNDSFMALSYHLHVMLTQVKGASSEQIARGEAIPLEHLQYGTAVVLIGLVLVVNSFSIGLRMFLRTRKKW